MHDAGFTMQPPAERPAGTARGIPAPRAMDEQGYSSEEPCWAPPRIKLPRLHARPCRARRQLRCLNRVREYQVVSIDSDGREQAFAGHIALGGRELGSLEPFLGGDAECLTETERTKRVGRSERLAQ